MIAGPSWSSIRSVTIRSENASRSTWRSTFTLAPCALIARRRQREVIIIAGHALHIHQLLLAHVFERDIDDGDRNPQRAAEAGQGAITFNHQPAKNQIKDQRFRDPQLSEILRGRRIEGRGSWCVGN